MTYIWILSPGNSTSSLSSRRCHPVTQTARGEPVVKIFVKYMVSSRCKMVLRAELNKLSIHYGAISLGEAELAEGITRDQRIQLNLALLRSGLELMEDKKSILVERIKNVIVDMVHHADDPPRTKNSVHISDELHHDYTYLANLFSEMTGSTIEQFIIANRIERVKELLGYGELSLTDISFNMNYSSVGHLSRQFKQVTGITPTRYKQGFARQRASLESL